MDPVRTGYSLRSHPKQESFARACNNLLDNSFLQFWFIWVPRMTGAIIPPPNSGFSLEDNAFIKSPGWATLRVSLFTSWLLTYGFVSLDLIMLSYGLIFWLVAALGPFSFQSPQEDIDAVLNHSEQLVLRRELQRIP